MIFQCCFGWWEIEPLSQASASVRVPQTHGIHRIPWVTPKNKASPNPRISHNPHENCKLGVAHIAQTMYPKLSPHTKCVGFNIAVHLFNLASVRMLAHDTFSSCRKPAESLLLPLDFRTQQLPKIESIRIGI